MNKVKRALTSCVCIAISDYWNVAFFYLMPLSAILCVIFFLLLLLLEAKANLIGLWISQMRPSIQFLRVPVIIRHNIAQASHRTNAIFWYHILLIFLINCYTRKKNPSVAQLSRQNAHRSLYWVVIILRLLKNCWSNGNGKLSYSSRVWKSFDNRKQKQQHMEPKRNKTTTTNLVVRNITDLSDVKIIHSLPIRIERSPRKAQTKTIRPFNLLCLCVWVCRSYCGFIYRVIFTRTRPHFRRTKLSARKRAWAQIT